MLTRYNHNMILEVDEMKGIILAGGTGTRLAPATRVTNKHLLPVYNKPMIMYPLEQLVNSGIKHIMIVSGKDHAGHFLKLLGSGKDLGVKLSYEIQEDAGGIAQALGLCEHFADDDKLVVILGDNIFEDNIAEHVKEFESHDGSMIFLKEHPEAHRFGVAEVQGDKIVGIEEKPKQPKSNLAVTGLYMYPPEVFKVIKTLKPSARGEYEITDVNNHFINEGRAKFKVLEGFWSDAGTHESLYKASEFFRNKILNTKNEN